MDPFSRRNLLAFGAAGAVAAAASAANAASFGNPDEPPQGALNTQGNAASATDPGPANPALAKQFPGAFTPPATNVGDMPLFWASFNNAPRRIQNGGWARQVTQADFAISESISGVNMRLTRGGIRELHWHLAAEWAYVTRGACRITTIDQFGRSNVEDVREGGLWYFPSGLPHSLQGIGEDGCEFILCFDDGKATEFNTLLVTDWLAHTSPEDLALNFGVPVDTLSKIPLHDLYIFQGEMPGPLAAEQQQAAGEAGQPPLRSTFQLNEVAPSSKTRSGFVQVADSSNFKASKTIAAALVTIHSGGMRAMHWHPNADELIETIVPDGATIEAFEVDRVFPSIGRRVMVLNARKVYRPAKQTTQVLLAIEDVTEHRTLERERAAAHERVVALLQELGHRIKNSLQIIASIVSVEARSHKSGEGRAALERVSHRIAAIGRLYSVLEKANAVEEVDATTYLEELCRDLIASVQKEDGASIALKTDIESAPLPADRAIPLGLIVNALVTNAVKYAFPGETRGTVEVTLKRIPGELRLHVSDDGKGIDPRRTDSGVGGRLVETFARQLGGEVERESGDKGTIVRLKLNWAEPRARYARDGYFL